jgi:hypothetical protein
MSLDSLTYLVEVYWPFMACALLIGLVTGWFSVSKRKG